MPGESNEPLFDFPPMPATEAEWQAHWTFYKLTVAQRDAAWRQTDCRCVYVGQTPDPRGGSHPTYSSADGCPIHNPEVGNA